MIVTKLEAAHRQLQTAIALWVDDMDPVSIHTLAFAAYQVIHDLNRHARGSALLLDSDLIPAVERQAFINTLKADAVFFKHADDRPKGKKRDKAAFKSQSSIDFNPAINEIFFVFALKGLENLQQELTKYEFAFKVWYAIQHPEMLDDGGERAQQETFGVEVLASMRSAPKKQFFDVVITHWKRL